MSHDPHHLPPELEELLREIAARHRRRLWLRGLIHLGIILLAILIIMAGLLALGAGKRPALAGGALAMAVAAAACLAKPLRARFPLKQIAIYIDEHHPELENRIVSAVDFSSEREGIGSDVLIEKFYREIEGLVPGLALGDLLDTRALARLARTASLVWVALLAVSVLMQQRWLPLRPVRIASRPAPPGATKPDQIEIKPGNARVRRGSNLTVMATTRAAGDKVIQTRPPAGSWRSETMQPSQSEEVHYHQYLNLQDDLEYQVRVGTRSSPVYKLTVWTPPEVKSIDLSYHYPAYLKLAGKEVANGGEISAVEGTKVDLDVEMNKELAKATLVLESGARIELDRRTAGRWGGGIEITKNDRYHIELLDNEGEKSELNREYRITAVPDKPPKIEIAFPRGDSEATAIEEIPLAFKVGDDFGLADYGVQYSVAGEAPRRISLRTTSTQELEAHGRHLLALEKLGLQTGDLITWTVWATDLKPDRKEYETASDPYFLEIRPFRRTYSEAVSNEGGEASPQEQAGGNPQSRQSGDEKQIIIATWNLRREAAGLEAPEYEKRRQAILKAQQGLLEKAQQGGGPMQMPAAGDDGAGKAAEAMKQVVQSLGDAKPPEPEPQLSEALIHEQEAYRQLLRAKPRQAQVRQARSQQGGQSGQQRQEGEQDLAQMELDRRRDFRDEASTQRTRQQQEQEQNAQALDELKELAKRQRILNEDMAKLLSEKQAPKDETPEETRRRLERLRAEQQRNLAQLDRLAGEVASNHPEQRQTQQELQQARQQMNRSVENLRQNQVQEARSAGSRALDSLGEAQSRFEQLGGATAGQRLAGLREQMKQMQDRQAAITSGTQQLKEQAARPGLDRASATQGKVDDLLRQKDELAKQLNGLLGQAGDLAEKSAQNQQLMSRKLGDWMRATGRRGIPEAIGQGRPLLQYGIWDAAKNQEEAVGDQLNEATAGLNAISESMVQDDLQAMQRALSELQGILDENRDRMSARAGQDRSREGNGLTSGTRARPGSMSQQEDTSQSAAQGNQRPQGEAGKKGGGKAQSAAGQPKEQGGKSGQQGNRPGQKSGKQQAQSGKAGRKGDGQGRGKGGENTQQARAEGQQPGDGQPGAGEQARGQGGRRQGQPNDANANAGARQANEGGAYRGGAYPAGGRGGWYRGGGVPRSPDELRRFFEGDYRRWVEGLRNAEALLPEDDLNRGRIADIRNRIDTMRRAWLRDQALPEEGTFDKEVELPLVQAAAELEREIARKLTAQEFNLSGEGAIPAQYADRVAEYFKALSEQEKTK